MGGMITAMARSTKDFPAEPATHSPAIMGYLLLLQVLASVNRERKLAIIANGTGHALER
jgi:hypothetical protein